MVFWRRSFIGAIHSPMMQKLRQALVQYWGYEDFLPQQKEAMMCLCGKRDCIVVLPTGGGKSLCYQAPAAALDGMAVVVSPLISLMKDQVDGLIECGMAAMRLDSSLTPDEQDNVLARIREHSLKVLYLSPERLLSNGFTDLLRQTPLSFFAIDEAHCVSMWGHDFRPEYRQLGRLKAFFPGVTIAAYTATATAQVRRDIAEQLQLNNPQMLIGSFDRPNLIYKIMPRREMVRQVCEVIDRHPGDSGIIYCIRRKDVDALCGQLQKKGYRAAAYHAGMNDEARKENQDRFIHEQVDIIVATIAFGMGIDKSNVRYVIHTGMPKSLEHYQQESGRAGRDGLDAECCLFYSGGDFGIWKSLMRDMPEEAYKIALVKLEAIYRFCTGAVCRHKTILNYFGQDTAQENCQACDICLGEFDSMSDALIIAQKILSCVLRLGQRFGGAYTAAVLVGSTDKRIIENGHDKLTTYNLLSDYPAAEVQNWIEQLVGQGYLVKTGEYNVLEVTAKGRIVLKGNETPRLLKPAQKPGKISKTAAASWQGVDRGLFEVLRRLRTEIAAAKRLPAYLVFDDTALRDMARRRPATPENLLLVQGVGQRKSQQYGKRFLEAICLYCRRQALETDIEPKPEKSHSIGRIKSEKTIKPGEAKEMAFALFQQRKSIPEVAAAIERAASTTTEYLVEYLQGEKITDPQPWVDPTAFHDVVHAVEAVGAERLKPIFDFMQERVDYHQIRICLTCLRNR